MKKSIKFFFIENHNHLHKIKPYKQYNTKNLVKKAQKLRNLKKNEG